MARFLNPFNFVRPVPAPQNLPPLSEDTADLHLLWRCPPPPHDRYTGLSGRITCIMTAKTPVFVSDSEDYEPKDDPKAHKTYRFFNVNGDDVIPASSLRGSIRSVFEAATNSTFGAFTFKDEPLFYRQPPEVALGLVPARVEQDENSESGYKLRLLSNECSITIGQRNPVTFYGAWLPRYPNERILLKPRWTTGRDGRQYDRHKHLLTEDELVTIPPNCVDGSLCYAAIINTQTLPNSDRKGYPHLEAEYVNNDKAKVESWVRKQRNRQYSVVAGYVHITGLNADVKQYERFFCTNEDETDSYVQLPKKQAIAYNNLMRDYHQRKDSIANSLSNAERKGIQPSRFIQQLEQLKEGTLVYADLEGTNANPTIRAIYPVAISRTMYERTIRDVIADHHPHLLPPTNINELCLASRVFGWVSQEGDEDLTREVAYRGRIRFSNATVTHAIRNDDPLTLSILGTPHPTSLEFYLDGITNIKPQRNAKHGYSEPNAKIRGRKIYRHHKKWITAEDNTTKTEATTNDKSDQNRTIQGVYEPDSGWTFTIEFENLQPVELGALLWSLELRDEFVYDDNQSIAFEGYHRIGYGKPLGFGSVQIEVTGLDFYDAKTRYTSEQTELAGGKEHKPELIQRFQTEMSRLYGDAAFDQLDNIEDLLKLLCEPEEGLSIHYPRPEYEGRGEKGNEGFQWFMTNRDDKKGKQEYLGTADADKGLPYYTRKQEK